MLINWFEIPVVDMPRAVDFYQRVLDMTLTPHSVLDIEMALFPHHKPDVGGALVKHGMFTPSSQAGVVYFCTPNLAGALKRADEAGGKTVLGPETLPNGIGSIALIIDSEGNRIGLHQAA